MLREPELVTQIVEALCTPPFVEIPAAKRKPHDGGTPVEPGYYAWWCKAGSYPGGVPASQHPKHPLGLLYVGIAPRDDASNARLRSRLCSQHIGGNAHSSTFRLGLSALLWRQRGWCPCLSASGKALLPNRENAELSKWQRDYLRLRWLPVEAPYRAGLERAVIELMQPPMNRHHNERHRFYAKMGRTRDAFRAAARANGPCL